MARNVQAHLEAEADKKGLTGDQRKAYIGGAWARIKHHEGGRSREWWRDSREYAALSALVGPVEEIKTVKGKRDTVYFRQGDEWYELPQAEYFRLSHEGRALLREQEREARDEKRRERSAEREREYQQKQLEGLERAQYREVLDILRERGGVKPSVSRQSGKERDASEYRMLPSSVRNTRGRLTMDEAATEINQHMPWLHLDTPDDLVQFFERTGTKRREDQARKYNERAAKVAEKKRKQREEEAPMTPRKTWQEMRPYIETTEKRLKGHGLADSSRSALDYENQRYREGYFLAPDTHTGKLDPVTRHSRLSVWLSEGPGRDLPKEEQEQYRTELKRLSGMIHGRRSRIDSKAS